MKKEMIFMLGIILVLSATVYSQSKTSRFYLQHKSQFVKDHLQQTEKMLLRSLKSSNANMVSSSIQTIRELEQVFPDEPFNSFIEPLSNIIRDEKGNTDTRILSALALDELHSDIGDASIYEVAKRTRDQSVKDICKALAIESYKADEKSMSLR